ncbi:MAG: hypothetical protein UFD09_09015 [Prevotella sp.]|nr:hypothetical protein [Prevotella sp.]
MNKFSERLRYSVGGTYRTCGFGKYLRMDEGSLRYSFPSSVICQLAFLIR